MKKNNNNLIWGLLLLAVLITGISTFSLIGTEDIISCEIPYGGGECSLNITIPQDRALGKYVIDMDFKKVSDNVFIEEQTLTPIASYLNGREEDEGSYYDTNEYYNTYIYEIPYDDFYELEVIAEVSGDCSTNSGEYGRAYVELEIRGSNDRYTSQGTFKVCTADRMADCSEDYLEKYNVWDYRDDGEDGFGLRNYVTPTNTSNIFATQETLDSACGCFEESCTQSGTAIEKAIIPFYSDKDYIEYNHNYFYVTSQRTERTGGDASVSEPVVTIKRSLAQLPSNTKMFVGDYELGTLEGTQNETISTLDFSDVINFKCDRQTDISECTIPITFKSSTGGVIEISEDYEMKVAIAGEILEELEAQQIIIDETKTEIIDQTQTIYTTTESNQTTEEEIDYTKYIIIAGAVVIIGSLILLIIKKVNKK